MPQSKELTEFYRAYLAWVEQGAPEHDVFSRGYGLCPTLEIYLDEMGYKEAACSVASDEMQGQFVEAYDARQIVRAYYPFNPKAGSYNEECEQRRTHLNPKRVQWVREHCNND